MGGTTYYLSYDQVGSLRLVADASGNVVKRISYDSFGNILEDTNPSFTIPFGFAGGLHDRGTGLVRFGYRDYDPEVGRWTAKDPIGFAGGDTDLYGYVLNYPINFTDPYGLKTLGEYWVPVEHFLSPFVVGGGAIISGAFVGTSGAVLTATSVAVIPETFGLSTVGIPIGVSLVAAGEYQVMFGTTTIINHVNNLIGTDIPSLSDYSRLFPAFPPGHNDHHELNTGGPCEK
jgi:RHS repeat-associated protein